jgi:hypothetical protein
MEFVKGSRGELQILHKRLMVHFVRSVSNPPRGRSGLTPPASNDCGTDARRQ